MSETLKPPTPEQQQAIEKIKELLFKLVDFHSLPEAEQKAREQERVLLGFEVQSQVMKLGKFYDLGPAIGQMAKHFAEVRQHEKNVSEARKEAARKFLEETLPSFIGRENDPTLGADIVKCISLFLKTLEKAVKPSYLNEKRVEELVKEKMDEYHQSIGKGAVGNPTNQIIINNGGFGGTGIPKPAKAARKVDQALEEAADVMIEDLSALSADQLENAISKAEKSLERIQKKFRKAKSLGSSVDKEEIQSTVESLEQWIQNAKKALSELREKNDDKKFEERMKKLEDKKKEEAEKEAKANEAKDSEKVDLALKPEEEAEIKMLAEDATVAKNLDAMVSDIVKAEPHAKESEELSGAKDQFVAAQGRVKKSLEDMKTATGDALEKARQELSDALVEMKKALVHAEKIRSTLSSKLYAGSIPTQIRDLKSALGEITKKADTIAANNKKIMDASKKQIEDAKKKAEGKQSDDGGGKDGGNENDGHREDDHHEKEGGSHDKEHKDHGHDKHGAHSHFHGYSVASFSPDKDPDAFVTDLGNSFSAMSLKTVFPKKFGAAAAHGAHSAGHGAHGHGAADKKTNPDKHAAAHSDKKEEKGGKDAKPEAKKDDHGKKEKAH